VERSFNARHRIDILHECIIPGRVGALVPSARGCPSCYVVGIHNHDFSAEEVRKVKNATSRLSSASSAQLPLPGIGIVVGDFNYTLRDGCRWSSLRGEGMMSLPPSYADRRSQKSFGWLEEFLVNATRPEATFVRCAKPVAARRTHSVSSSSTSSTSSGSESSSGKSSSSSSSCIYFSGLGAPAVVVDKEGMLRHWITRLLILLVGNRCILLFLQAGLTIRTCSFQMVLLITPLSPFQLHLVLHS
jgi:hypothetical protein